MDCYESTKKIIIVCEDIYGLDIYMMVEAINSRALQIGKNSYKVFGFISDVTAPFGVLNPPAPVLGNILDWSVDGSFTYVMGIRNPESKEQAVKILKRRGAEFETLIAPWVLLPSEFETGEGCIIGNYSCKYKSKFGDFVTLDTVMCETVEVGDYSTICPFVNLTNATIGKKVYIGSHAIVMEHKVIGDDVHIFPGSVVVKDVKQGSVVAGVPASKTAIKKWL